MRMKFRDPQAGAVQWPWACNCGEQLPPPGWDTGREGRSWDPGRRSYGVGSWPKPCLPRGTQPIQRHGKAGSGDSPWPSTPPSLPPISWRRLPLTEGQEVEGPGKASGSCQPPGHRVGTDCRADVGANRTRPAHSNMWLHIWDVYFKLISSVFLSSLLFRILNFNNFT